MAENSNIWLLDHIDREKEELNIIKATRLDPKCFGELYKLYVNQVFKYLYSRVGNVKEAEDLTAQTFLSAFEAFYQFRQDGHFASWLFRIARNKTIDHFRKKEKTTSFEEIADIGAENDLLNNAIDSEQKMKLTALILELGEEEKEILRLRFLAGMSFIEIAHTLQRNEEAVKKTIYRLLARLHSQLEVTNE